MALDFKLPKVVIRRSMGEGLFTASPRTNPLEPWKYVLGLLALANLAAFFLLVRPMGGSASDLEAQLGNIQMQIKRQQLSLSSLRSLVTKMEGARGQHDKFMETYFMDRRTMSSTILTEIKDSASAAGLVPKEHSFAFESIEGADNLGMMTITANYEGTYADLVKFVNLIDRSKRFLIIDNIQAAPQQQGGKLVSRFKINAFVREMPAGALAADPAQPLEKLPVPAASTAAEVRR